MGKAARAARSRDAKADGDPVTELLPYSYHGAGTVSFTGSGLPTGLTLSSGGGIAGTIATTADAASPYSFTVSASDGTYTSEPTTVTLTVQDPENPAPPSDVTLARGFIPPETVFPEPIGVSGVFAIKITGFNKGTSNQFSTVIGNAMAASRPPSGLLIDLRGNRGGVLRQAVLVADSLMPS